MAIIDRIKYDGPAFDGPWLIYKYPSDEFVLGSQLIVNQSQEALFLRGGKALDLFGPGTHTLTTGNLPILKRLVNIPFGGKTPFSAEIYYVNTTARLDNKWGTSVPFQVTDPKYNIIMAVRAFGQYGITISDARLFITKIVGAVNSDHISNHDDVRKYFNGLISTKIKEVVSSYIIHRKISLLEITTYLGELSEFCQSAINDEFNRFGIDLHNFYIESVNFPNNNIDKLKEALERKSELTVLGEDYYRQRSFDVLEKLAGNEAAGSAANAGIGLGMGLGTGTAAGSAFADLARNLQVAPDASSVTGKETSNSIVCNKCSHKNAPDSKFCGNCGDQFDHSVKCHNCHEELPAGSKFCGQCGQPQGIKKCSRCGHSNKPNNLFCEECGTKC
ncbi:SPFH domain-containing protein [Bacillus sp. FJAT-49705]|uniref:SPFH domain-containing protein n=1 Tax=Cytobacillus citreus TaxID=2833586 RepID=A0ABS5NPA0_9BACI|nr:SPFH domain-containing protein [Cytobacillus citreus]MBS4189655.1 SPFH domain-containing protein [Cytobacillus citreus]